MLLPARLTVLCCLPSCPLLLSACFLSGASVAVANGCVSQPLLERGDHATVAAGQLEPQATAAAADEADKTLTLQQLNERAASINCPTPPEGLRERMLCLLILLPIQNKGPGLPRSLFGVFEGGPYFVKALVPK